MMRILFGLAVLLCASCLAWPQEGHKDSKDSQELTRILPAIERALRKGTDDLGDVVIDIEPRAVAIGSAQSGGESLRLRFLAAGLDRTLVMASDVAVMRRRAADIFGSSRENASNLLAWLEGLGPSALEELRAGRFLVGSLAPDERIRLLRAVSPGGGAAAALFDPSRDVRLGIGLSLTIELGSGPNSVKDVLTPSFRPSPTPLASRSSKALEQTPPRPRLAGPIKFREGRLLTLREILDIASPFMDGAIRLDQRLESGYYFIRGEFTPESFFEAMKVVLEVEPTRMEPRAGDRVQAKIRDLIRTLNLARNSAEPWAKSLDLDAILSSGKVRLSDLAAASPSLAERIKEMGLDPGTEARVRPGIAFSVDPGGFIPGTSTSNGFTYVLR